MISQGFEITAKDFGYDLVFTVRDNDGNIVDLTGVTSVKLKVNYLGSDRHLFTADADAQVPLTEGKVKYTVQQNDFANAGNFIGVLTLVYDDDKEITSAHFNITVNKAG